MTLDISDPFDDLAMPFNWRLENDGQSAHLTAGDSGGWTSWGVTFATWQAWQRLHGDPDDTLATFKSLPRTAFLPIFRINYWQAVRADETHPAVSLMVFDAAVGSGPRIAIELLQKALGLPESEIDGLFGNKVTMPAVKAADPQKLVKAVASARIAHYVGTFAHGWDRRTDDCEALALSLFGPPPKLPSVPTAPVVQAQDEADALDARFDPANKSG